MANSPPIGELEQLILLAILRLGPDAYGLSIARELEAQAGRRLSRGALGWILSIGIDVGLGAAWALGRIVGNLLFEITPTDAVSTTVAVLVLVVAGALAAWIPARRASRIDPIGALRYE